MKARLLIAAALLVLASCAVQTPAQQPLAPQPQTGAATWRAPEPGERTGPGLRAPRCPALPALPTRATRAQQTAYLRTVIHLYADCAEDSS